MIRIVISDNAVGFEPAKAERLFERGVSTKNRDSGLGLHQCRAIIKSHGGAMWLDSPGINQGAQVFIKLPTTKEDSV